MKFAVFVDGPNLMGSLWNFNLNVDDYQSFYDHIIERAAQEWETCVVGREKAPKTLVWRVFWYQIGSIDELNFENPALEKSLRKSFDSSRELKRIFVSIAEKENPGLDIREIEEVAWKKCFNEGREWYERKKTDLKKMKQFNHAVRRNTRFVDIIECGHWKTDLLGKHLHEKGIDTSLAVDLATMTDSYDVAVVMSGDADMLPSINHAKKHKGKHIGIVELNNDTFGEAKGQQSSSRLRNYADFIVSVKKTDLLAKGIGMERQNY